MRTRGSATRSATNSSAWSTKSGLCPAPRRGAIGSWSRSNIYCGSCFFCTRGLYSNCHNVNPNAIAIGSIYGYSHTAGGYDGGQAEYVRGPFRGRRPSTIPDWMDDEDALMCTDALATGYFGAQLGDIAKGDVVVVFRSRTGRPLRRVHTSGPRVATRQSTHGPSPTPTPARSRPSPNPTTRAGSGTRKVASTIERLSRSHQGDQAVVLACCWRSTSKQQSPVLKSPRTRFGSRNPAPARPRHRRRHPPRRTGSRPAPPRSDR
jgi:hypothetical protein